MTNSELTEKTLSLFNQANWDEWRKYVTNDATMEDARAAGLDEIVEVMDNGRDAPGTLLSWCSPEFQSEMQQADLIVAKGQAQYETLSEDPEPGRLFFLLKVKCPVIAGDLGRPLQSFVLTDRPDYVADSGEKVASCAQDPIVEREQVLQEN